MGFITFPPNPEVMAEIEVVERHLHGHERWFGLHGAYDSPDDCGSVDSTAPFVLTTGDDNPGTGSWVYGPWLCLLGTNDTPIVGGMTLFDPHSVNVVDVTTKSVEHKLQFACGADTNAADAAVAAGEVTELLLVPVDTKTGDRVLGMIEDREVAGVPFWGRVAAKGQDADSIGLFIGIHEYPE